ncbi:MAG: glycoside-pentoside-hexuronide (GPH):cation symporter [Arachnia sp.]
MNGLGGDPTSAGDSTAPDRWRNRLSFGLGTIGRDMSAALVSLYLVFYLTEVVNISSATLVAVTVIIVVMRIFDALNDPVMGVVVDNTRSRWGKFKPWIAVGAVLWATATLLLFVNKGVGGPIFLLLFAVAYLMWGISYTINDISFYGMLPSLSRGLKEREAIGVVARIAANVGLFSVVVGVIPITGLLTTLLGSEQRAWFVFALILVSLMLAFQSLTLIFTRQRVVAPAARTPLRELFAVITRNDQLMWVTGAMLLFMAGYTATTSLGIYYFKYVYGDEGMYPFFALILGVAQLTGLAIFPLVSKRLKRRQIHGLASVMCATGLAVFALAGSSMLLIAVAGVLLFAGQAFIQLLMLLFIADCVEYGEWKLGRRNESVTFALQPFIYKASNALGTGLVGIALLVSGISRAQQASDLTASGVVWFKVVMMLVPLLLVIISWVVLRRGYTLDEERYAVIVSDLRKREGSS